MQRSTILFFIAILFSYSCNFHDPVRVGLDRVGEFTSLFDGKRLGIITNHTAYNSENQHIIDIFNSMPNVTISALFGPEHGIRGEEAAGRKIDDGVDPLNKIPIFSLYGKNRKPSSKMISSIDMLVFDIQDIGSRFYTYIYTMALAMEAAAENNIPFVVLDRPNPINGLDVEGNILEPNFSSFVGLYPIPVRHGLTVGELARMINQNGWLKDGITADLTVISMKNWLRQMWFDQTGLRWRPPSPNMPSLDIATVYPGTCLFEGTNISEGRGTYQPFLRIGAPWFNGNQFSIINNILALGGAHLGPLVFTPISIPSMAPNPKFCNERITGIAISVTDRNKYQPYLSGISLVKYFYDTDRENFKWREGHFDRLCGTDKIRKHIITGRKLGALTSWLDGERDLFIHERKKYLLY